MSNTPNLYPTIILPERREVLFEKYAGKERVMLNEMENFLYEKLNGCEIKISEKEEYKDYVFYVKEDIILFYHRREELLKQESKNGYFNVRYDEIWSVFERRFGLDYEQIQVLIKREVERHLKLEGLTPFLQELLPQYWVERHLKQGNI